MCVDVWVRGDRFDFGGQQYVAGVMEEDDPGHGDRPLMGRPLAGPGRSFTLYLYDLDRHQVGRCDVLCGV